MGGSGYWVFLKSSSSSPFGNLDVMSYSAPFDLISPRLRPKNTTCTEVWGTVHTEVFSFPREPKSPCKPPCGVGRPQNVTTCKCVATSPHGGLHGGYSVCRQLGPGSRREFDVSILSRSTNSDISFILRNCNNYY